MRQPLVLAAANAAILLAAAAPAFAQQQQGGAASSQQQPAAAAAALPRATANLVDPQGRSIGTATLTQMPAGVLIQLEVKGLPPGERAFHIHAVGRCDGADGFQSAGGHYNPENRQHGFRVQGGPHAGDLPNQFVGQDGVLRTEVINPNVTLGPGRATLFDADGSSLVIHAKADDHHSQPAGDAGGRIACGVIERRG